MSYKKNKFLLIILICIINLISCKSDDKEVETFLCCGNNPFASLNVNNLIRTSGLVIIPNVFTPNIDGINDEYIISLLTSYPNHFVTISDINDNIVFETLESQREIIWFDGKNQNGEELQFGTYKYKIVIENEETFVQYGYLCLVRNSSETNGFDFSNCITPQTLPDADPVLIN